VALLHSPELLQLLNDDIDWTWRLGEAVIAQQNDVIAAVESFRDRAYAAGNLKTDEYQTVTVEDGTIEIEPVDEEIIYVPYYEPDEVVVYQPRRVYYYYPDPYPVYYYPYPVGHHFHSGFFWGVTTAFHIGWSNHYLHVYHPSYWGHPYYGHNYYDYYWYRRPSITVYNTWYVNNSYRPSNYRYRDGDYWRPRHGAGSRPDEPRVRNYYYPPNSSERTDGTGRNAYSVSNRDRLRVRDDGRMDLNLRERRGTPVRPDDRAATNIADRQGFASTRDDSRAVTRSRGTDGSNRNTAGGNRLSASRDNERAVSRNGNDTGRRTTTTSNRRAEGFASADSTRGSAERGNGGRPEIRFRDRSNDGTLTSNSSTTRRSTGSSNRATASSREAVTGNRSFTGRQPNSSTARDSDSGRRNVAAPTTRQNPGSNRTTNRSTRQSTASRPTESAPRVSAPTRSAPSSSAPPARSTPSRSSAPSRSSPPASSGSRSSTGRSSSGRGSEGSGRRSSSRGRDRN
jgi:hypothetical protein